MFDIASWTPEMWMLFKERAGHVELGLKDTSKLSRKKENREEHFYKLAASRFANFVETGILNL